MGQYGGAKLGPHRRIERTRVPPGKQLYSTSFSGTENPLRESGAWLEAGAEGLDWNNCSKTPGKCIGEHSNTVDFSDPTAVIDPVFRAFAPDQAAQAVVTSTSPPSAYIQEVELRLRSSISAHACSGYEIYWRVLPADANAYYAVTRWNGAYNDFTTILIVHGSDVGRTDLGCQNGDTLRAEIEGSTISLFKNGGLVDTVIDGTYATGQPGLGFYMTPGHVASKGDFGFTSFSAEDL